MNEVIETLKKADNEATAEPYWLILDPTQNMSCDVYMLASQITGPYFSREDAQNYLDAKKHNFSNRAVVFCLSGYASRKYKEFYRGITNDE